MIPSEFPELGSDRLLLRQLIPSDAGKIFELRNDEDVNRYLDREKATTPEGALEFIQMIGKAISESKSYYWAIIEKVNNQFAGTICLWNFDLKGPLLM